MCNSAVNGFVFVGFNLFKTFFENVNLCDHRLKRQGTQLVSPLIKYKTALPTQIFDTVSDTVVFFSAWNVWTWRGWILSGASPWKALMKK